MWLLTLVAMATIYLYSTKHIYYMCEVSFEWDVSFWNYTKKSDFSSFSPNLTSDLWPLTFTSENLADTSSNPRVPSHQVWKRSVQPTRRSRSHKFPLFSSFFRLKIHTSPSITWRLMSVAMVTIYFGSSSHPHDTCKVSCQCDVPLQKYCKNMIFTKFDLWPLTFDLYFR